MPSYTGTSGNDTIKPTVVSAGVTSSVPGSKPGADGDTLSGGAGNDAMDGGEGADQLFGGADNDTLAGGAENDFLSGDDGVDDLTGGDGDDTLNGGVGSDTYRFTTTSGFDTVNEAAASGTDTLAFGAGISAATLDVFVQGDDLIVRYGANQLVVTDQFATGQGANARVEQIRFANNTVLNLRNLDTDWVNRVGTAGNDSITGSIFADVLNGAAGNDVLSGGALNDQLLGGSGADQLFGGADNDILGGGAENDFLSGDVGIDLLNGGAGTDTLNGGADNDTYAFDNVAGIDTVNEAAGAGADRLLFNATVTAALVKFSVQGDDLVLNYGANQIIVTDQYQTGTGADARVETAVIEGNIVSLVTPQASWLVRSGSNNGDSFSGSIFADTLNGLGGNDVLSGGLLNDLLNGGAGGDQLFGGAADDTLDGGAEDDSLNGDVGVDRLTGGLGADTLNGGADNDLYFFDPGFGSDVINEANGAGTDQIRFNAGILLSQVKFSVVGDDLIVTNGANQIVVTDQYASGTGASARVELVRFDNATVVDLKTPAAAWLIRSGTAANDSITGSIFADTLNGLDGDDVIASGIANDQLLGSGGNDQLFGQQGDDTLNGGAENDSLFGDTGTDNLYGGDGDDQLQGGVDNDFYRFTGQFGVDTISEAVDAGNDVVVFAADIAPASVKISVQGDDLVFSSAAGSITVVDQYANGVGALARVETVLFQSGGSSSGLATPLAAWLIRNGTASGDSLSGSIFADTLNGLGGNDQLVGGGENDKLNGGSGSDTLFGQAGDDQLNGGNGSDQLIGDAGADRFIFNATLLATGVDSISGFEHGVDKIALENAVYTKLVAAGALSAAFFVNGTAANDANDYLIYTQATGALFYDADGSGAGAQVQIAALSGVLTNTDFVVT